MKFLEWLNWLYTRRWFLTAWIWYSTGAMIGSAWDGEGIPAVINGACVGVFRIWRARVDAASQE